ncbi:hypothetical protein Y032_0026g1391 [Ancylostoma ceylanicum]|uniref:SXP/RAL-2 family protein Ani s 5-like cation-binding domain-containing protein n=1 Tax=Ancylostoma ceylanicum TaxID=53326 RepID=A0A016UWH0_9BILA|nr:hypothetical protein Y032_0026g1391 [Ancylostoma ceylanicum]
MSSSILPWVFPRMHPAAEITKRSEMLLLVLLGVACCIAAVPVQAPEKLPVPKFPFLDEVNDEGKQEFQKIFNTQDLTRSQWETKMLAWAEKYNIKQSFLNYKEKLEKDKEAAEAELMATMEKLMQFFKEYQAVGDNYNLTWKQAAEQREELVKKLTPKQIEAAALLGELFAPVDQSQAAQQKPQEQYVPGPYGLQEQNEYGVGEQGHSYGETAYQAVQYGQSPYGEKASQ